MRNRCRGTSYVREIGHRTRDRGHMTFEEREFCLYVMCPLSRVLCPISRTDTDLHLAPALEQQRGVGATESERIRQGVLHIDLARLVRNIVEIAVRIGCLVIDGRRNDSALHNQRRDSCFNRSRRAEQMSNHGLRRTHGQLTGMLTEEL